MLLKQQLLVLFKPRQFEETPKKWASRKVFEQQENCPSEYTVVKSQAKSL